MGKTLKDTEPERYAAIVNDLKAGKSLAAVQRDNRAGSESVGRIKNELLNKGELRNWKARTAGKAALLAERMIDKMSNELDTMKAGSLPIASAVLIDKCQQLAGEPAQIVEHRLEVGQNLGGWLGDRAEKPAPIRTIDAEIVENQGKTDQDNGLSNLGGEKTGAETADGGEGGEKSPPPPS